MVVSLEFKNTLVEVFVVVIAIVVENAPADISGRRRF
jgi:hypothetical protein